MSNTTPSPNESFELMPHMAPHIRISPFLPQAWDHLLKKFPVNRKALSSSFWLDGGRSIKFLNSGRQALEACLRLEKLKRNDEVLIVTTTQGPYISSCVTKTIEKVCKWSRRLTTKTRLVLVIHEFGFPCPPSRIKAYQKKGLPVLEDCAYAIGSRIEGAPVGTFGDYAIYSLTKYYPIPFGGILVSRNSMGFEIPDIPKKDKALIKATIGNAAGHQRQWDQARRSNWQFFSNRLRTSRIKPYFSLDKKTVPGIFLAKVPKNFKGNIRKKNLIAAGVESTEYYGQGGFYFPIHQFLTSYEKEYILYHFLKSTK